MRALFSSLRWRLFLVYALTTGLLFAGAAFLIQGNVAARFLAVQERQTRNNIYWSLTAAEPSGSLAVESLSDVAGALAVSPDSATSYFLLDEQGQLLGALGQGSRNFVDYSEHDDFFAALLAGAESFIVDASAALPYRTLVYLVPVFDPTGQQLGLIQAQVRLTETDNALATLRRILAGSFGLTFLGACVAWVVLTRSTLHPLERLAVAARQVSQGALNHRSPVPSGPAELRDTALAFNQMLDALQASIERERAAQGRMRIFIADASHELRSPLTALNGYVDVLLQGAKENPAQLAQILQGMKQVLERLKRLTNDLLTLSRLDAGLPLAKREVDLNELTRQAVELTRPSVNAITLDFQPGPPLPVAADADSLQRAIQNLLENALRSTAPAGHVSVQVGRHDGQAEVTIRDDGPGIPPEHLPHVFERFYRVEPTRGEGTGLGLPIVKATLEAHGGEIHLESTPGAGTVARLRLPLLP